MAEVLRQFADEIDAAKDFNNAVAKLIKNTVKQHMRIISNGITIPMNGKKRLKNGAY